MVAVTMSLMALFILGRPCEVQENGLYPIVISKIELPFTFHEGF